MRRHNAVPGSRSMPKVVRCAIAATVFLSIGVGISLSQGTDPAGKLPLPPGVVPAAPSRATPVQIGNLPLGVITFPNGKAINFSVSFGSSAFRLNGDSQGRVWLMTDRGPSIPCADARKVIGMEPEQICPAERNGRIYPLPGFVPSIYAVDIGPDNVARINVYVPLKGQSGRPFSGRPIAKDEVSIGLDGKVLPGDTSGVDPEGFVRLKDGSFWIAEEFGPSLLEVASDGTVKRRLVPSNVAQEFKDADYEVVASLPPILRQRLPGRGFEGLAISQDEKYLFTVSQSPLANPDAMAARSSRNLRIWKIERETGQVVGQYLYQLDEPYQFKADNDQRARARHEVKVSEIVAFEGDQLLVLERIEKSARIYAVRLDEASRVPPEFDSLEMSPSLEILEGDALQIRGISPLTKRPVLDLDTIPGLPGRIEGLAILDSSELLIINDSEFGLDGVRNQLFRITLDEPLWR